MREVSHDEKLIRRFLLGELDAGEQRRLEELFMINNEYEEKFLMEENELIEDYLEGALSESETKQFRAHFLSSPQQRQKLRIAKLIKTHIAADSSPDVEAIPRRDQKPPEHYHVSLRNPFFVLPAAALIIFIAFSTIWLVRQRLSNLREQEQSRRIQTERELAQLNDPLNASQLPTGEHVFSVVLLPISVRSIAPKSPLSPPVKTSIIELSLVLTTNEYQSYQAILQKAATRESFTIQGLQIRNTSNGKVVVVKIPAYLLTNGDYQLELSGLTANDKLEETEKYSFQVINDTTH